MASTVSCLPEDVVLTSYSILPDDRHFLSLKASWSRWRLNTSPSLEEREGGQTVTKCKRVEEREMVEREGEGPR